MPVVTTDHHHAHGNALEHHLEARARLEQIRFVGLQVTREHVERAPDLPQLVAIAHVGARGTLTQVEALDRLGHASGRRTQRRVHHDSGDDQQREQRQREGHVGFQRVPARRGRSAGQIEARERKPVLGDAGAGGPVTCFARNARELDGQRRVHRAVLAREPHAGARRVLGEPQRPLERGRAGGAALDPGAVAAIESP